MVYCPKCGRKNLDNAKFCAYCGANIAEEKKIPEWKSIDTGEQRKIEGIKKQQKDIVRLIVVLGFIAVVVIIGLIAMAFIYSGLEGSPPESNGGNPTNQLPKAYLTASPTSGYASLDVTFYLNATDSDGTIASWALDIDNDGNMDYMAAGSPPNSQKHVYRTTGKYEAKFIVYDNNHSSAYDTIGITVKAACRWDYSIEYTDFVGYGMAKNNFDFAIVTLRIENYAERSINTNPWNWELEIDNVTYSHSSETYSDEINCTVAEIGTGGSITTQMVFEVPEDRHSSPKLKYTGLFPPKMVRDDTLLP